MQFVCAQILETADADGVVRGPSRREDLREWIERLDELQIPHSPEIEASIGWLLVFNDPDGLEIHVYTDSEHGADHGDRPGYGRRVGMAG